MPKLPPKAWTRHPKTLALLGVRRAELFCNANNVPLPTVNLVEYKWTIRSCAYYRSNHIELCLPWCGHPCPEANCANWTWPASVTDREPYGVLCHELAHHCDWTRSDIKSRRTYSGNYSVLIRKASGEKQLTGYVGNDPRDYDAEWFAEMMRLFITNHALLKLVRPKTHALLMRDWKPVSSNDYLYELGTNCPARVLRSLDNKMVRV